jgi:tryptophan-rich sensory protein
MMKIVRLLTALLACFAAAAIGSWATMPSISTWYAALNKPFFTPPSWLFGPAWTLLYILMAVAAWLVWEQGLAKQEVRLGLLLFAAQLAANSLWSILFFGQHWPWGAYAEIIVLWLLIVATMVQFNKVSKTATWLLLPYILWVTFASFLNLGVALLN